MDRTVFYSWQSDLPGSTNRYFIAEALKKAAAVIDKDDTVEDAPRIDSDTAGVPGSPDISRVIFEKIEVADVFVCDVSIVNDLSTRPLIRELIEQEKARLADRLDQRDMIVQLEKLAKTLTDRPMPNPNVLIELGYAMKILGEQRILMIMNEAFGRRDDLPFDLRRNRVQYFRLRENSADKAGVRKELESYFEQALRVIFSTTAAAPPVAAPTLSALADATVAAVTNNQSNRTVSVKQFIAQMINDLDVLKPVWDGGDELDEILVTALNATEAHVTLYARIAQTIADVNDEEAAQALYRSFAEFLKRYNPARLDGTTNEFDFDFFKFVGHELFTIFFALLIKERRWNLIGDLLDVEFYVDNPSSGSPGMRPYSALSEEAQLLRRRKFRLNLRTFSAHADLLA